MMLPLATDISAALSGPASEASGSDQAETSPARTYSWLPDGELHLIFLGHRIMVQVQSTLFRFTIGIRSGTFRVSSN